MTTLELTNEQIVTKLLTSNEILDNHIDKTNFSSKEIRFEEKEPSKYVFIRQ